MAFLGLELAGNPEAGDALIGLLQDEELGNVNRTRAAVALATFPNPTIDMIDALQVASEPVSENEHGQEDIRNSAAYAIGSIENQARGQGQEVAEHARDLIQDEEDARVRKAATESFTYQAASVDRAPPAQVLDAAIQALPIEEHPIVRAALVRLIGLAVDSYPAARLALVAQFHLEKDNAIKVLIGRFVSSSDLFPNP